MRFRYSSGSPKMQQVRRLVRFSLHRRLRFSIYHTASVRILRTAALRYNTLPGPGNNSIRLGRTDASRQNSKTRDARSISYHGTGVMLYQALREFNGNCESYCSLEQLVALLCSAHEENLPPIRIIRSQKATPEDTCTDLQVCCVVGGALGLE